jgi:hypothetical protein
VTGSSLVMPVRATSGGAGYPFPGTCGHAGGGGVCFAPLNFSVASLEATGSLAGADAQNIVPLPSWTRIVTVFCGALASV